MNWTDILVIVSIAGALAVLFVTRHEHVDLEERVKRLESWRDKIND